MTKLVYLKWNYLGRHVVAVLRPPALSAVGKRAAGFSPETASALLQAEDPLQKTVERKQCYTGATRHTRWILNQMSKPKP